jgi:superfamily II DNA or RNA helicase
MNTKKTPIDMLLSYQRPHVNQLYEAFQKYNCALDASDTGTGKTYTSLALCHLLNLKPFIVCPKSVINSWLDVAKLMNIEVLGISNYEKIKRCKYYTPDYEIIQCPYVDKIKLPTNRYKCTARADYKLPESYYYDKIMKQNKSKDGFKVQLPVDTIIIVDEAHRCKNHKSDNSILLLGMKESNRKILLLSATLTDKVECFAPFGVIFGIYNDILIYKRWLRSDTYTHYYWDSSISGYRYKYNTPLEFIHNTIFPARGSRMKIKELGDLFPQNQVIAKCYYSDDHEKVDKLYDMIQEALEDLKDKETRAEGLGKIVKCRMKIEMFKVPIILDLIYSALEEGNFKDSMNYINQHLKEKCSLIHGGQTLEERDKNIKDFQTNKTKVIISIIQAGGVGISLHDLHGRPRMSIISPSWSGTDMVQALGRIHRAGSKSRAVQRIVYIAKSYEEKICETVGEKLKVLSGINDGDLIGPNIPIEKLKDTGYLDETNKNIALSTADGNGENNNIDDIKIIKKKKFKIIENKPNEQSAI